VALHIAGTAGDGARLKTGVDKDLLIKAVATGSGGSRKFGIRAPWMAERRLFAASKARRSLAHISTREADGGTSRCRDRI